jgi:polyamine oxidase
MVWVSAPLTLLLGCLTLASAGVIPSEEENPGSNPRILIVGGGVAGVIAARTLREQGLNNFVIIEARNELGGRLQGRTFGKGAKMFYVEDGANWIQGMETKGVRTNPILKLARKHDIKTKFSDYVTSISAFFINNF